MDHAQPVPAPFPWRGAAVVAVAVALVELVALIAIGLAHFAHASTTSGVAAAGTQHRAATTPARPAAHAVEPKPVARAPLRPVSQTRVLVLNGNGVTGAAGAEAARLQARGYRIAGAADAERHDYSQSMVFFVPGWQREALRLAHSIGIPVVAPIDGIRGAQLRGSKVVLLLGK